MKKLLFATALLALSVSSFSADVVNEKMQGVRSSNGEVCVLAHRQLEYAPGELFVSFHASSDESWKTPDAGLLEAMGLDFATYKKVLYSNDDVSATASAGSYNYSIKASSDGADRTVSISGLSVPDANRASLGMINIRHGLVQSVTLTKQAKTIFGNWKNIFQDTCSSITKNY
jgi:hypothetical protein